MTVKEIINKVNNKFGREVLTFGLYCDLLSHYPQTKIIDNVMFWFEATDELDDGFLWLKLKYKRMDSMIHDGISIIEGEDGYTYIEEKCIPLMMNRYSMVARNIKDTKKAVNTTYNVLLILNWFEKHKPKYSLYGLDIANTLVCVLRDIGTDDRLTHPGKFANFCISWLNEHSDHIERMEKNTDCFSEAEVYDILSNMLRKIL